MPNFGIVVTREMYRQDGIDTIDLMEQVPNVLVGCKAAYVCTRLGVMLWMSWSMLIMTCFKVILLQFVRVCNSSQSLDALPSTYRRSRRPSSFDSSAFTWPFFFVGKCLLVALVCPVYAGQKQVTDLRLKSPYSTQKISESTLLPPHLGLSMLMHKAHRSCRPPTSASSLRRSDAKSVSNPCCLMHGCVWYMTAWGNAIICCAWCAVYSRHCVAAAAQEPFVCPNELKRIVAGSPGGPVDDASTSVPRSIDRPGSAQGDLTLCHKPYCSYPIGPILLAGLFCLS